MSRADTSDSEIAKSVDDLKKGAINWTLLGYVPKSDTKIKVVETGTGDLAELADNFNDGKVLFAFISFEINKTKKFVYISWCGEGVTGMKKGLFNNHSQDVAGLFKGFHVQVNARNENDVLEKDIVAKLTKATGASYDSGQKVQGNAKLVPTSVAQGKVQATQSNAKERLADKSDYNKKNESSEFWNKDKQEEETKVAPKPLQRNAPEYNKTNERNQFWANQKQDTSAPQKQTTNIASGNANSIKSRFENANKQEQAPQRPPVQTGRVKQTSVPPKHNAPTPPKQKEPEPEPEYQPQPEPEAQYEPEEPQHDAPQAPYEETQQQEEQSWGNEEQQNYEEQPQQQEEQSWGNEQQQNYDDQGQAQDQQWDENQQQNYDDQGTASTGGDIVRALYDFQAENETDLSFKEGDMINVLDRTDPSGWYEGELNGVRGYFPSNFVEENA